MRKLILLTFLICFSLKNQAQTANFYSNGANISIGDSSVLLINGNFDLDEKNGISQSTFVVNGDLKVEGNFINNTENLFKNSTGTLSFVGDLESVIIGDYPLFLSHLVINKSGNIFLETPVTVSDTLELNNGIIVLENNFLSIENQLTSSSTYCDTVMISTEGDAPLYLSVTEDREDYYLPVGTVEHFAPVNIKASSISTFGFNPRFAIRTIDKVHGILPNDNNYLMRYWDISNENFTSSSYLLDFEFSEADIVGDPRLFYALKMKTKNGSFWPDPYGLIDGINRTFTIENTTLGEFTAAQIGGSEFSDVIVFPNPNDGEFFIKVVNKTDEDMKYHFFDINGAFMFGGVTNEGVFPFDFSDYPAGTYFYKIYFGDRIVTRKIIVNQ